MKLVVCGILCALGATAHADRCEDGKAFAANGDLPRAALYLESCDGEYAKLKAHVAHKLDATKLSALTVVTSPSGLDATTDAMPGETFTTPATIWAKAGAYTVIVGNLSTDVTLEPYSRRTVIINVVVPKAAREHTGTVDFNDEPDEQASHTGPPPAQKWQSIVPNRYQKQEPGSGGPQLEDPLATHTSDSALAWSLGARVGGGVTLDGHAAFSVAAFSVAALARRSLDGPLSLAARVGWTHRRIDAATLELGIGVQLLTSHSATVSGGVGLRGEVRVQDHLAMEHVARVGLGAAASIDVALGSFPMVVGLRIEPAFTELTPRTHAHGLLLEAGYDWR